MPGIEINCDVEGGEIHILGYGMDYEAVWFQDFCRAQRAERRERVHRMAERLAALGMPIDPEAVFALVQEGSAGRPHVAQVMVDRGYVKSVREAFDRFLGAGKPGHVPRKKLTPADAVRLLRRAGGVPVFAHPGLAGRDDLIPALVRGGPHGDRVLLPRALRGPETGGYVELCRQHGLVATGGSDFHGPRVRASQLGDPSIPLAVWEALSGQIAEARASRPA